MDSSQHGKQSADELFGPVHIVQPKEKHTFTVIWLHGRGSSGEEFADEFLTSNMSRGHSLPEAFPDYRWVLPSSRTLWSTAFQEDMPAWFEAHSLTDITALQHLQVAGVRESVLHILQIIGDEVQLLDGDSRRLILGGISQGAAVGFWVLFYSLTQFMELGGFIGLSTWLPFCDIVERTLSSQEGLVSDKEHTLEHNDTDEYVRSMMPSSRLISSGASLPTIFLGHGSDDAYVDVELGKRACRVLSEIGLNVQWKEYSGADEEGHWIKEPEEMDDICDFLTRLRRKHV